MARTSCLSLVHRPHSFPDTCCIYTMYPAFPFLLRVEGGWVCTRLILPRLDALVYWTLAFWLRPAERARESVPSQTGSIVPVRDKMQSAAGIFFLPWLHRLCWKRLAMNAAPLSSSPNDSSSAITHLVVTGGKKNNTYWTLRHVLNENEGTLYCTGTLEMD